MDSIIHIDLYANAVADPLGFGEALSRLTNFNVTTDSAGHATFTQTVTVPGSGPFGGPISAIFTANATGGNGATGPTSEFSNALGFGIPTNSVDIGDAAVVEGNSGTRVATFKVSLKTPATSAVSVHFQTHDLAMPGAATAGVDYDAQEGDVTFAAGEQNKNISIVVHGDTTAEQRERFGLTLSNPSGAFFTDAEATGTILDDDHHLFFTGQAVGSHAEIRNETGALVRAFFAFAPTFQGGVRVASGDVNGDGVNDLIAGSGDGARIRVYDGKNVVPVFDSHHNIIGTRPVLLYDRLPYNNGYRGGVNVAAGDVNGDGYADIIVAPSAGSSGLVKVINGKDGNPLSSFVVFGRSAGGVRVAAGDINGDGYADIIAGSGAGSSVIVFDGKTVPNNSSPNRLKTITAFASATGAPTYLGGVSVASGDVDGDGLDDVIVGKATASNIANNVQLFLSGRPGSPVLFNAFGGATRGINIGATDVNGDGIADIIAAQARSARPQILIYAGASKLSAPPVRIPNNLTAFTTFDSAYIGGMFVG